MTQFAVKFIGRVTGPGGVPAQNVEEHLDSVMDELLRLKVQDAAIGIAEATGQVEVTVTVSATELEEALNEGGSAIRSAIHAAGGTTPNWEVHWVSAESRAADLVDA